MPNDAGVRSHAVIEDTYIWPLLEAKRPGAVAQMGIAHEPVESDLDVVDAAINLRRGAYGSLGALSTASIRPIDETSAEYLLGLDVADGATEIEMSGSTVRFVSDQSQNEWTIELKAAADDATTVKQALTFALEHAANPQEWIFEGYRAVLLGFE